MGIDIIRKLVFAAACTATLGLAAAPNNTLAAPREKALDALPLLPMSTGAPLKSPGGIAVAGDRVAISDTGHNRIVLADRDGRVHAVIGNGCSGGHNGSYDEAEFSQPHGLTFHDGRLYVADTRGQRVRVIGLEEKKVATLAGNGNRAFVTSGRFPARKAMLNSPWDVQWAKGHLYVSMAGEHAIWRYDPATRRIGPWAGSGHEGLLDGDLQTAKFARSSGLDAHGGTLYVADSGSSAIRAIDLDAGRVGTLIGTGLFNLGMRSDTALLRHPRGLTYRGGSLYIADTDNNALRRLDLQDRQLTTMARSLSSPRAVAIIEPDTLLVVEAGANQVEAVTLSTGATSAWPLKGLKPPQSCTDHAK